MESIINFRPINNLKTKDNAYIKNNRFFRSAAPEYGTKHDFKTLSTLHLDTIIDFRDEHEKNISLQQNFNRKFNRKPVPINVANIFSANNSEKFVINEENIHTYYHQIYQALPTDYAPQYRQLMQNINEGQTLLFHCSAGKDRTGFAAYLILSALNAHIDDIMEDYLRSNATALKLYESRKNEHDNTLSTDLPTEIIQQLFGVKETYLTSAIQTIQQNFKDTNQYLTKMLMVDIDKVHQHYLE